MLKKIFQCGAALIVGFAVLTPAFADPIEGPLSVKNPIAYTEKGCTAFYIGNNEMVTAGHCFLNSVTQTFTFSDGTKLTGNLKVYSNPFLDGSDFSVFKINGSGIAPLKLDCELPAIDTKITVTGYPAIAEPGDLGRWVVHGTVAGTLQKTYAGHAVNRGVIPLDLSVHGGFSGSPVQNEKGDVVGILIAHVQNFPTMALATPIKQVCDAIGYEET